MQEWLYGPQGYYATAKVGKAGDFYTSVSTSMFFGGTLGKHVVEQVRRGQLSPTAHVVEIGAHQGHMMADMIQFIYSLEPSLATSLHFTVIEPLAPLRQLQQQTFESAFGDALHVKILPSLEALTCKEAVVVANELFDAFPCEVLTQEGMLYLENHLPFFKTPSPEIAAKAQEFGVEKGEIACGLEAFAQALARACERCEFIGFDYGEAYARNDISLRIYQDHQSTPFFELTCKAGSTERLVAFFAKADLTYDVNFAHVRQAMEQAGFSLSALQTQAKALVDFGLLELLELLKVHAGEDAYRKELEKAKQLLLPTFLGERFKMIRMIK